jgi:hypothetical protein
MVTNHELMGTDCLLGFGCNIVKYEEVPAVRLEKLQPTARLGCLFDVVLLMPTGIVRDASSNFATIRVSCEENSNSLKMLL